MKGILWGVLFLGMVLGAAHAVTLAWTRSASGSVAGYRIYWGVKSRTYTNHIDVGVATNVTDCTECQQATNGCGVVSNLVMWTTYFFAATAYDMNGVESVFSNEVHYTPTTTNEVVIVNGLMVKGAIGK